MTDATNTRIMSLPMAPISCEQHFSRRALGYLWSRRAELDPGQVTILDSLYKQRKKGSIDGAHMVEYRLTATGVGPLGFGRCYGSKGSLETLERECRGTMCRDFYVDIDVVNCHPVLLHQFALRYYGVNLHEVKQYCENRAAYLERIDPNRDVAKQAILQVLYYGKNTYDFLKPMVKEIKDFVKRHVAADAAYQELLGYVKSQNGNVYGAFLSHILQTEERKVMMALRGSFIRQGFHVDVLAYDGVMLRKGIDQTDEHLRAAEADVLGETRYAITLSRKEFEFFEIPADVEDEVADEWKGKIRVETDIDAGRHMYANLSDRLVYSKGAFYYKPKLTWICNIEQIKSSLRSTVMDCPLYKKGAKGQPIAYAQNIACARNIVQTILDIAVTHYDDLWIQTLYSSSLGYVLFNNGYWDFRRGVFVGVEDAGFDAGIRFVESIPFDFCAEPNHSKMEEIRHKLFVEPFGSTVADYYLLTLARGLAGDRMKRFLVGIGPGNTGKSMITGALRAACGGYFDGWNGGNLLSRQTSQDEGAQLRWLYLLRSKRIIVSSELKTSGSVDGNMMKKMTNGGEDDMKGRKHCEDETSFQVFLLPILFAQDLPKIKPVDDAIQRRVRAIPYKMVYTDEPSHPLELKRDKTLPLQVVTDEFRQAFLHLMFSAYTTWVQGGELESDPEEIRVAGDEVMGTQATVIDAFKEAFEVTNDPNDYLCSSAIDEWLKGQSLGISMMKFGMEMKRYAEVNQLEHVVSKQKRIGKKNMHVWTGMREFQEET